MKITTVLALSLAAALGGSALAQPPADAVALSEGPLQMSMEYEGTLYPFDVLPLRLLTIHSNGRSTADGGYSADTSFRLAGWVRALKRIDIDAHTEGRVGDDGKARPVDFNYVNTDGKKTQKVHVGWRPGDVVVDAAPNYKDLGHPPATLAQKLSATDPLTHFVRVAGAAGPDEICGPPDRFFDGKQFYALEFGHPQPAKLPDNLAGLGLANASQCTVHMDQIAGYRPKKPGESDGLKSPIVMVFAQAGGPTGPWVITDVHVETVLGRADIALRKIAVQGRRPKV